MITWWELGLLAFCVWVLPFIMFRLLAPKAKR